MRGSCIRYPGSQGASLQRSLSHSDRHRSSQRWESTWVRHTGTHGELSDHQPVMQFAAISLKLYKVCQLLDCFSIVEKWRSPRHSLYPWKTQAWAPGRIKGHSVSAVTAAGEGESSKRQQAHGTQTQHHSPWAQSPALSSPIC